MKKLLIFLIIFLSLAPQALAAFGDFVQKATEVNTSGTSVTIGGAGFSSNVTAGNSLHAAVRTAGTGRTATMTSNSTPASFTADAAMDMGSDFGMMWSYYGLNQAGGVKPTLTFAISGASVTIRMLLIEMVGSANTHIDKTATATGTGTSLSSGVTATRTDATEYQIGVGVVSAQKEFTAGSGFTERSQIPAGALGKVSIETITRTVTGTEVADMALSGSDDWAMTTATFSDTVAAAVLIIPEVIMQGKNIINGGGKIK